MTKVISETVIKIGKEPVILMPLRRWEQIQDMLADLKEAERFDIAWKESRGEKKIGLTALKKKYNL